MKKQVLLKTVLESGHFFLRETRGNTRTVGVQRKVEWEEAKLNKVISEESASGRVLAGRVSARHDSTGRERAGEGEGEYCIYHT